MTEAASDSDLSDLAEILERRSFKTYSARNQASIRLTRRGRAWNAALIALATSSTAASIGLLTEPDLYGPRGSTLLVCVAVLSLVASLVVTGLDYSGRSRDMFVNYRKVQRLSGEAERLKTDPSATRAHLAQLWDRYDELLDDSENHTAGDYRRLDRKPGLSAEALKAYAAWSVLREDLVTWTPYGALAIPVALLIPLLRVLIG